MPPKGVGFPDPLSGTLKSAHGSGTFRTASSAACRVLTSASLRAASSARRLASSPLVSACFDCSSVTSVAPCFRFMVATAAIAATVTATPAVLQSAIELELITDAAEAYEAKRWPDGKIPTQTQDCGLETICARTAVAAGFETSMRLSAARSDFSRHIAHPVAGKLFNLIVRHQMDVEPRIKQVHDRKRVLRGPSAFKDCICIVGRDFSRFVITHAKHFN